MSRRRAIPAALAALLVALATTAACHAQPPAASELAPLRVVNRAATVVTGEGAPFVRLDEREHDGIAWLPASDFATGALTLEVRGADRPGRSFVGVAFGGRSDSTYEAVYLRPFNFHAADSAARAHAIQYIAHPEHRWKRLRDEHPGVFEQPLAPAPAPDAWVRLRIVVTADSVHAYVNDAARPALAVRRLAPGAAGLVGYWVGNPSAGDFRGLRVRPDA